MRPEGFPDIQLHPEFDTDEARQEMFAQMQAADHELGDRLLEAPGVSRTEEKDRGSHRYWVRSIEIDPLERLAATHGPFIELAGPSHRKFEQVDTNRLPRNLITTNIDVATYDGRQSFTGAPWARPDVRADGRQMPIRDQQAGAVFARAFGGLLEYTDRTETPQELADGFLRVAADRGRALQEAWRITEPGGVLVWEEGLRIDIAYAEKLGFRPLMLHLEKLHQINPDLEHIGNSSPLRIGELWSAVMEKPATSPAEAESAVE